MKEFCSLIGLFFLVKWRQLKEERKVRKCFYSHDSFRQCDRLLHAAYLFNNPYHISKTFLMQKGEKDIHLYGETPLTGLFQIAKKCGLKSEDYFIELGCGRGRGVFFLSHLFNCRAKGIEWIPEFVEKACAIAQHSSDENVSFSCEDMYEADLSEATIVYLYGTCLDEFSIRKIVKCLKKTSPGTKIITVSYSLTEYSDDFSLQDRFTISYPWGEADIYLHILKSP